MEPSATDFSLPKFWPRCWALDIDRAHASVLFSAHDRETDTLYIYSEFIMPRHELALVADAVRAKARWVPGLFDHLARKRSQEEGQRIIDKLLDMHLEIFTVQVDPDAGASEVAHRLSTKRLKVFSNCKQWLAQFRSYRRNKEGDIVEESDGLMRAMDLLAMQAPHYAAHDEQTVQDAQADWADKTRSEVTGY